VSEILNKGKFSIEKCRFQALYLHKYLPITKLTLIITPEPYWLMKVHREPTDFRLNAWQLWIDQACLFTSTGNITQLNRFVVIIYSWPIV
jgi:hypothetical protein